MTVEIANEQDSLPLDEERFRGEIDALAGRAGFPGRLSVAVVTDAAIREINRRFLDHDFETDVIAFPLDEDDGEIVVSADRAIEEAGERGVDPMAELMLYVVHGILHLLGYDDHEPADAREMHDRSLILLAELGYRNTIPAPEREGKERTS